MPEPRRHRIYDSGRAVVTPLLMGMAFTLTACGQNDGPATSKGTYDPQTGQLRQITYDRNQNGRIDTWTRMEGARPISSELDTNEDGIIDRWEEYDAQARLVRAGWMRAPITPGAGATPTKGTPDTWLYPSNDGKTSRIEFLDFDNNGNQVVARREFYEGERLVRVEEDKDGDGAVDQWEHWLNGVLHTVEFDEGKDGKPDRRFTYTAGVLVLIETGPDGSGGYTRRVVPGGR